jgi:hypothetical protein
MHWGRGPIALPLGSRDPKFRTASSPLSARACIMIIPGGETQRRHDTGCMRRRAAGAISLSALNYDPTCFLVLTSFLSLSLTQRSDSFINFQRESEKGTTCSAV